MAKSKYIEALEEQYTKKDSKSVLRYKAPDNKWRYVQTSKDASGGNMPSGGGMTEVTWQELKDKRDNGELNPGSLYRITDYNCTTTQENTQSAGHQFDIVLLALSENKLAEEGWAMMNESNIYDVTFSDGVTKKCYIYYTGVEGEEYNIVDVETLDGIGAEPAESVVINEETKTAVVDEDSTGLIGHGLTYNYFQNSNLSAWKVWYCLDNDKSRFAWADDSVDEGTPASITYRTYKDFTYTRNSSIDKVEDGVQYYGWGTGTFTKTLDIVVGETQCWNNVGTLLSTISAYTPGQEGTGLPNGRGVIYRMIDEWNIDCPCDFKNMQMLVPMDSDDNIDIQNPVRYKYCYAFTDNTSGDPEDLSIKGHAVNIKVKPKLIENANTVMYFSPETLFYTNHNEKQICKFSDVTVGIAGTTIFIDRGNAINILDGSSNVILKDCGAICIGYNSSNIMLDTVVCSTFGSYCKNIQLADNEGLNYGNYGVELATKGDLA